MIPGKVQARLSALGVTSTRGGHSCCAPFDATRERIEHARRTMASAGCDAAGGPGPGSGRPPSLSDVVFTQYTDEETQMGPLTSLIDQELSEPYSIFTYRYFINNWPKLCIMAHLGDKCIGVVICKVPALGQGFRLAASRTRRAQFPWDAFS